MDREERQGALAELAAVAGKDEDTPYDYDHILPYNHWGNWTGTRGREDSLLEFADREYWIVGNAIGNVRVWPMISNRQDGDASPRKKLRLDVDCDERTQFLKDSAIDDAQIEVWIKASGTEDMERSWSSRSHSSVPESGRGAHV